MLSRNAPVWSGIHTMTGEGRSAGSAHITWRSAGDGLRTSDAAEMRLSSVPENASARFGVQGSGRTLGTRGKFTVSHGLTPILLGTASFKAARRTANMRAMRAG